MDGLFSPTMTRRELLSLSAMTAAAWAAGCAANPVTGRRQLMLVSEAQEIQLDKQNSPYQLSADYGVTQDPQLAAYLSRTGSHLAANTHRPGMPYAFHAVNATYVNAYAFPGGSIATTRAILLKLKNEAELAALLGHELGHVNARHTAQIMSKSMLATAVIGGLAGAVQAGTGYGGLAGQLGMLGSGALLAAYSRGNERQADSLGLAYMVKAGYGPEGMVGLMEMLNSMSKGHHSAAELLFATHPMSDERYQTAVREANTSYAAAKGQPLHPERYMDQTAGLRRIKGAIEAMQKAETALAAEKYSTAEEQLGLALKQAPEDYTGLLLMAKCQLAQKKVKAAAPHLAKARQVYPEEAQAHYLGGYAHLQQKQYDEAINAFDAYNKRLPGNPYVSFFKGLAHEGSGRKEPAAQQYMQFLKSVKEGDKAQYAYRRLVEWGYVKGQ
jgi:predicted Zn-dependent protease